MTRRFIVDANLPIALAKRIAGDGHDCLHVADLGSVTLLDSEIWVLAEADARTIISRDGDFSQLSMLRPSGPAVVWLRMGNVRKRALLDRLSQELPRICSLLDAGERLIEIR